MTADLLRVRAYWQDGWEEDFDLRFYKGLPNAQISTVDAKTGRPVAPIPDFKNTMGTVVLAVLSSTVLATTIQTTLTKEPTRIEISIQKGNEKKQLIFQGPHIKESREEIEALLNDLTKEHQGEVQIVAKRKSSGPKKPPPCPSK
jgi:hypothetical protein